MIFDGHIHVGGSEVAEAAFAARLKFAGVAGGIVISRPPSAASASVRINNVLAWCKSAENLYPAFWIDPTDRAAVRQVSLAADRGIAAFKVICSSYRAGDRRCMKTYRAIARTGKPLLFHSGILWDGRPSSVFNRPAEFEALLEIDSLRFSLAHISWPWVDECLAVYGKFQNARTRRPDLSVEMFIDTTPGTPPIYRKDALTKLYTIGYDVQNNVFFGSDCVTGAGYNSTWTRQWVRRDKAILHDLSMSKAVVDKMFSKNLQRFLGLVDEEVERQPLRPADRKE